MGFNLQTVVSLKRYLSCRKHKKKQKNINKSLKNSDKSFVIKYYNYLLGKKQG